MLNKPVYPAGLDSEEGFVVTGLLAAAPAAGSYFDAAEKAVFAWMKGLLAATPCGRKGFNLDYAPGYGASLAGYWPKRPDAGAGLVEVSCFFGALPNNPPPPVDVGGAVVAGAATVVPGGLAASGF